MHNYSKLLELALSEFELSEFEFSCTPNSGKTLDWSPGACAIRKKNKRKEEV